MTLIFKKIVSRFLKNRIKPFVISELILLIVYILVSYYALKDHQVNFFYNGLGQMIMAVIWLLLGIENFRLKKKGISIAWFILSLLFICLSLQTFFLLSIKQ